MRSAASTMAPAHTRLGDVLVLAKVRLNSLVVFTAAGGYYMASRSAVDGLALAAVCAGTGLVAGGASAINQVMERDLDRMMDRTRDRPVADGRLSVSDAMWLASGMSVAGLIILAVVTTIAAALVALATLAIYVFAYTPLKRRTSLATIVGAVPGALPPLIGWTAAGGTLDSPAPWTLFLLMFLWQLPHFLAISWLYRGDYARAGLPMLAVLDPRGAVVGRQAMLWAATLVAFSLLPGTAGLVGPAYAVGAIALGLALLGVAVAFALQRSETRARWLFFASITYLPLLMAFMAFTRR